MFILGFILGIIVGVAGLFLWQRIKTHKSLENLRRHRTKSEIDKKFKAWQKRSLCGKGRILNWRLG